MMIVNGYLGITTTRVARTVEVAMDIDVDVDEDGNVVGVETHGRAPDFDVLIEVLRLARIPRDLKSRE